MISYAGSPGHEMVAALGVLLVAVAVVVVRRRRKRAGREPAVAVPSATVDVAEPPLVAPAPAPASVGPRVEAFRVTARRPGVHNSRFARGAGARPAEGARHFATALANRR